MKENFIINKIESLKKNLDTYDRGKTEIILYYKGNNISTGIKINLTDNIKKRILKLNSVIKLEEDMVLIEKPIMEGIETSDNYENIQINNKHKNKSIKKIFEEANCP